MNGPEEFKIEKNVPMKAFYQTGMTNILRKMEVGDSFFIDQSDSRNVRNRSYSIAKRIGIKITVRKVEDGCRLWRIE